MEFSHLVEERYSVRAFTPDTVEQEKLDRVLEAARRVLGLPNHVEPVAFTPLGYPADEARPKKRKPIQELVRYGRW